MCARPTLDDPVQYLPGVGPIRAGEFARLGVRTVRDLIAHLPSRHALRPQSVPIGSLELGAVATVVGEVRGVRTRGPLHDPTVQTTVVDGTGECTVRWFHSPHLVDKLHHGQVVRLTGKVDVHQDRARFTNPQLAILGDGEDPFADDEDRHDGVYPATAALPSRHIARIIRGTLPQVADQLVDFLPQTLRRRHGLPPRRTAFQRCHEPVKIEDVPVARRRLAYDELLLCQLAVQLARRRAQQSASTEPICVNDEVDRRIRRRLPFALTAGQDRAVAEIRADLARSQPMNRMLQADVGAGKTAVAVYAALAAIAQKQQAALLAPTEVLAEQHRGKLEQYLAGSRVRVGFLSGAIPKSRRAPLLAALAAGEVDLLIGTHALLEPEVRFARLGLVIVDEQQKFGVVQRAALRAKGRAPHTLVLTATPIPRTLAMTVFGDLDVTTITDAPPGRRPVVTRLVTEGKQADAWAFVRSRLQRGQQAYVVFPLVDESEELPLKAACAEGQRLSRSELAGARLEVVHGKMRPADKAAIMERFRGGATQVLVSTTVIEVGVDVPNATVMIVQNAERFGLSQLHQLRGRVGRGEEQSYCLLFPESFGETSLARLRILCATNDGFRIAEEDLRLRGPGELLGTRQHGIPAFKIADLVADFELLEQARDDAAGLLRGDPRLTHPEHRLLREELLRVYADSLPLVDVA
ncbi:MAG: ATP-dependent DNA helicase RecG [Planctomycetes bacterium]|nr:ATP-dependent DNA helicase RecG [Planctomycetota bacterium]